MILQGSLATIGNDNASIMNLIKKREKLNNSALGVQSTKAKVVVNEQNTPQLAHQLNKLYSQKRTPTASGTPSYPPNMNPKQPSQ